jgi:23S rRNA pseudouridine2604 synthase
MIDQGGPEGVRLAKRVAAQQACSRSQAESLISAGAVQVDGQVVTDPARRVAADALVKVSTDTAVEAMTVLLHKPAGTVAAEALRQSWTDSGLGLRPAARLQELLPLPQQASGLSVWSDERPVMRRLLDRERPPETEWLLSMPMAAAGLIAALQAGGVRASLGHERDGIGQWRLVDKGDRGQALVDFLDASQFASAWSLRRQRIGRQGLAPLSVGQARLRLDFEKF